MFYFDFMVSIDSSGLFELSKLIYEYMHDANKEKICF